MIMLAEINFTAWPDTLKVSAGLFGLVVIATALLKCWNEAKKAFGKRPPIDDQLKEIHALIRKGDAAVHRRVDVIEEDVAERFTNLAIDRQRTLDGLWKDGINPIRDMVQRLIGNMEERNRNEQRPR